MQSKEETFTSFTPEQAAAYAANRGSSYPKPLYEAILSYHTGAQQNFLDVGTGPGKVVFDLLPHFNGTGLGCDTSVALIGQAQQEATKLRVEPPRTQFSVHGGEDCVAALRDSGVASVDLITSAMAAHWFNLPQFYSAAAKALRPGGTLALWTCSSYYCHPSTPNAKLVQKALSELEDDMLGPYMAPGNAISRQAYETLDLPWQIAETEGMFVREDFVRRDWDRDGVPSAPDNADGSPGPFLVGAEEDVEAFGKGFSSASAVVRWRQANPGRAGTEEDPVVIMMTRLRELLGGRSFMAGPSTSLLLMRRV